jgi:hypothetical protein
LNLALYKTVAEDTKIISIGPRKRNMSNEALPNIASQKEIGNINMENININDLKSPSQNCSSSK